MYPEGCPSLDVPYPGLTGDTYLPGIHSLRSSLDGWLPLTSFFPKNLTVLLDTARGKAPLMH